MYKFTYKLRWYRDNSSLLLGAFFIGEGFMEEIILFLMSFVFMFIVYQIFLVGPAKRRAKDKKKQKDREKKELVEVKYLVKKYKLDLNKISYNQLLQIVALVSSFDISLIVSIIMSLNNFLMEIIIGFVATLLIIMMSYHLVYLFYKKKGMIINE